MRLRRWSVLAWFSLALIALIWILVNVLGDQYWWTVAILFGPRWVWGVILLGTLPQLIRRPREGIWPLLIGTYIYLFGLLDLRLGLGRITAPATGNLRVMEFNVDGDVGGPEKIARLIEFIKQQHPDLAILPECSSKTSTLLRQQLADYALRTDLSICLLSNNEIISWDVRDPSDFWKRYGAGVIVRSEVRTAGGRIRLGLVHLATPRRALSNYNDSTRVEKMETSTSQNLVLRDLESEAASDWIMAGDSLPMIVAGDFNMPVESAIYRRHWSGFQNALSATGFGLVHTKMLRLWGIRIDHVLARRGVQVVRAWVGPDLGSDHLPVIADLLVGR